MSARRPMAKHVVEIERPSIVRYWRCQPNESFRLNVRNRLERFGVA